MATKAKCNTLECLDCHRTDCLYYVHINRSGSLFFIIEVFDFMHKTLSALRNSGASVFQWPNYTAVIRNAIHSYAKRPLKRRVRISEVWIIEVPLYSLSTYNGAKSLHFESKSHLLI